MRYRLRTLLIVLAFVIPGCGGETPASKADPMGERPKSTNAPEVPTSLQPKGAENQPLPGSVLPGPGMKIRGE